MSWASGCGFGKLYCGAYCYAQRLPNWLFARPEGAAWGEALVIKANAPELLAAQLARMRERRSLRIFMSPVTDPYQPIERKLRLTRRCLDVFARYDELDLLLIQTRGLAAADDLDRIAAIPYAWLGVTIETDRDDLPYGPSAGHIKRLLALVKRAVARGARVQVAVSPCLPHSPRFAQRLLETRAQRIVIDTFATGDGSRGRRTSSSAFAARADYDWRDEALAERLAQRLRRWHDDVALGGEAFAGTPGRNAVNAPA